MKTAEPETSSRRWWHPLWYHLIMRLALIWFRVICRGRVDGEAHVLGNGAGGQIIAANHVSYLDWMVLHALFHYRYRRRLLFLAKSSLFDHPLWAPLISESSSIRVSDDGSTILDRGAFRRLRDAQAIGIFPEGTRSATGEPGVFHAGVARLAARLQIPVVPTSLSGFYESWPRQRRLPRPARCSIRFGAPVHVQVECARDSNMAAAHTQDIMQRVSDSLLRS